MTTGASEEVTSGARTGCCAGQPAGSFADRVDAGRRRRIALWRIQLAASAALTLAAIALAAAGRLAPAVLEPRLAWAASFVATGLVLGWLRQALASRQPGWRLIVSAAASVAGAAWQPLVPAVIATSFLAERLIRGADPAGAPAGYPPGVAD
ncbi:MAG: hypothetical protein J2P32_06505 [Actinobacteria bacterium]|nr:hypothetical protein [Actinomycetota bacterium]